MHRNTIPFKVAAGYCAVAVVLLLAIALVYSNTKSIFAINHASREYIRKREAADSVMSSLLKAEQANLQQLSEAMKERTGKNYLHEKVESLDRGEDSVVVHPKTPQKVQEKSTVVEVVKTRKGFFRRVADVFRKERADTVSIKVDNDTAVIDTVVTPVNVASNVVTILKQVDRKERVTTGHQAKAVHKEMADLKVINAQLALKSTQQLREVHRRERKSIQQSINQAMTAQRHLLWQMGMLAIVAVVAAVILIGYVWRDNRRERIYRENLEHANEEIQRIMQQRERLLLTITHDIKAPAASISGFIDMMRDYVDQPRGRECLDHIQGSARHLSHLVASLLDYHQLENGLMEVHPVNFSPSQLLRECVEGHRLKAEEKGLQMVLAWRDKTDGKTEQGGKGTICRADAFRFRQILDNLVGNAVKYTTQGSVSVVATLSANDNEEEKAFHLTVAVKDTGKGMTTQEKHDVFQAFTRLKNAQGIEGAGLGLSITHELASLLDGEIQVESVVGHGSTFTVTIPLEEKTEDAEMEETAEATPTLPAAEWEDSKILLLDDDPLQLQLLQEMLRRLPIAPEKVIVCHHVTDALTALHNEKPSLMLMDIEMPEMNGMEIIQHLNHTHMRVVAMTAHDSSILSQLKEVGFDDCLFKPFRVDALAKVLGVSQDHVSDTVPSPSQSTSIPPRFAPLVAFADDDPEAAEEIVRTVRQELAQYLVLLQQIQNPSTSSTDAANPTETPSSTTDISKIAHKLLPIATMMQMGCLDALTSLSPEHINDLEQPQIQQCLQTVIHDLQDILEEN